MPINVRAFTGTDHGGCNCYKCRAKRELEGFTVWFSSLADKFGGMVPRNYVINLHPSEDNPISLEQVESLKFAVEQVFKFNTNKLDHVTARTRYKYAFCIDCGKVHLNDDLRRTMHDGCLHYLCSECARTAYRLCGDCHVWKKRREFMRHRDIQYCAECFTRKFYRCSRCDRTFSLGTERRLEFHHPDGNQTPYVICPDCAENLHTCSTCGHNFFDHAQGVSDRRGMCASCFSDRSSIKQYSYKPAARWKVSTKTEKFRSDTLFAGFEWELENRSGHSSTGTRSLNHELQADKLSTLMGDGFIYFKRDGSLSNGFEVVTHPFTWQFYHDNREKFSDMVREAYKNGMRAETTCGFHIHMSKKAFSYGQLYKFVKVIYSVRNKDFIDSISERPHRTSYAAFRDTDQNRPAKFAKRKNNCSGDRHSAVNATGQNTVEVRFFGSTTNVLSFLKNIEFVFALYEYAGVCSYKQCAAEDFLEWLACRSNANKYRNLALWIKKSVTMPDSMRRKFRKQLKKNKANLNLKKGE